MIKACSFRPEKLILDDLLEISGEPRQVKVWQTIFTKGWTNFNH